MAGPLLSFVDPVRRPYAPPGMIRLALRMLVNDRVKWLGVILGVFFCTFLITHLLSMFEAMLQRTYATITDIPHADVWVMDPATEYVDETAGLPPTALDRVRGVPGVAWATPLLTSTVRCRLPNGMFRPVAVVGVDDATLLGAPERVLGGSVHDLRRADSVIVDAESAKSLLRMPIELPTRRPGWNLPDFSGPTRPLGVGDDLLLNDHLVRVVGLADLGPRFLSRATAYTTYSHALAIIPRQRNTLSYVLVKASPGEDPRELASRIERATGLRARTARDFSLATKDYFVRVSGVVSRIAFMVGIGVVVGACVSGLLLFLFTNENARFYAVFKALGAGSRLIVLMVVAQAVLSGIVGYALGIGISAGIGRLIKTPAMPYFLTWETLGFTGVTVMLVTTFSAVLSALKVIGLEPGRVFTT